MTNVIPGYPRSGDLGVCAQEFFARVMTVRKALVAPIGAAQQGTRVSIAATDLPTDLSVLASERSPD